MLGSNMPKVFQCMAGRWKLFKNIGNHQKKTPKRCFRELTFKEKMSAETLAVAVGVEWGSCLILWSCLYPDFWRR